MGLDRHKALQRVKLTQTSKAAPCSCGMQNSCIRPVSGGRMPSLCSKSILNDEEQWEMWPVLEVSSLCLGAGGAGDVARKAAVT